MLIPFGVFSAAGAGAGGAAGAYELISTAYGTGSSGVITFSSIPSTYKHLQIRYTAKSTSTSGELRLTYNGSSAANYVRHYLVGNGTNVQSGATTAASYIRLDDSVAASTTASAYAAGIIDILDYSNTTTNKTTRSFRGKADATNFVYLSSGVLLDTTAISSLTLTMSANNLTTGSRFSLYGIKG